MFSAQEYVAVFFQKMGLFQTIGWKSVCQVITFIVVRLPLSTMYFWNSWSLPKWCMYYNIKTLYRIIISDWYIFICVVVYFIHADVTLNIASIFWVYLNHLWIMVWSRFWRRKKMSKKQNKTRMYTKTKTNT